MLYQDALARAVEPSALQALEQALAAGLTPQQVALAILSSPEYRGDLVQQDYLHYLDRAFVAGPDGASALTQFPLGTTDEAVIALILGATHPTSSSTGRRPDRTAWPATNDGNAASHQTTSTAGVTVTIGVLPV